MKKPPVIKSIKQIGQSRLFTIEQLDLEFSNGEQAVFERIKANAGKAVMVAAITDEKEILLVREYAAGTERYELQLPKGIVELGEKSVDAANRELAEETGYAAENLKILQTLRVSPGYFNHETDLVLATELYEKKLDTGDEPEELEVVKYSLADIDSLLQRDDFSESRSIAGVLLVLRSFKV
ncbi:MAG: ADP compounds hydrolase NudE [Thiotrichaceae bacterium]|nr:ADP compounds hydrolase NudE [Thiotrichaceae bacterium]